MREASSKFLAAKGKDQRKCKLTTENSLVNAGRLKKENPKRYYEFALLDSLKEPFAKFRYYYRSVGKFRCHYHMDGAWLTSCRPARDPGRYY